MERRTTPAGRTLFVAREEAERGSKGPFFAVFTSETGETRWGYVCGHCESFETAMDSMGRIECGDCHNVSKADEWDAAHE